MLEYKVIEELGCKWIKLGGRIDAMTAPEIQQLFGELILDGVRALVADFEDVSYVSSAGLRVFLATNKQLQKVGGELILFDVPVFVASVFRVSGLESLFRVTDSREELEAWLTGNDTAVHIVTREVDSIPFSYIERQSEPGVLKSIGSLEPFAMARYSEEHVVSVKPKKSQFGTGLAALGKYYREYKDLFGESITINGNFFFFPAVKRPAVDFMLRADQDPGLEYRFLHGFLFEGGFRAIVGFEHVAGAIDLTRLVGALFEISSADILGLVIMAESKGLWGMHLKRVPTVENAPKNNKDIFDESSFSDWMSFPVEPCDMNNLVVAVGIAVRDPQRVAPAVVELLPKGSSFHIHGCVFSREPLDRRLDRFEVELERVIYELEAVKVEHLLGRSAFSGGMVGIVELGAEL